MTEVPLSPLQGVFLGASTLKKFFQHSASHRPFCIKPVAELCVYEHKLFLKKMNIFSLEEKHEILL